MKILYKEKNRADGIFLRFGIDQCYFKRIDDLRCERFVTKKEHSHTGYEIHIITSGEQRYEVAGRSLSVGVGEALLIPMGVRHRALGSSLSASKYSVSFSVLDGGRFPFLSAPHPYSVVRADEADATALCEKIYSEHRLCRELSSSLVENYVFELIVKLFRAAGAEERRGACEVSEENLKLELAKKYINDNIEKPISVTEVASYCYLGERQLSRLFSSFEGESAVEYIRRKRIRRIEKLLSDKELSLKEISSAMGFENEYYFNTYFKKYYGMPPGEYRRTLTEK